MMRFSYVEQTERKTLWGVRLSYLLLDAIIYFFGLYFAVDAALLRMDNVIELKGLLAPIFFFVTFLFASRALYVILYKAPMNYGLGLDLFSFFIMTAGAAVAATHVSGMGLYALPFWWHNLLSTIKHMASISPLIAVWLGISFSILVSQVGRRRPMAAIVCLPLVFIVTIISQLLIYGNFHFFHNLATLLGLTLFPLIGAVRGRPRLFARTLLIGSIGFFYFWHAIGAQPMLTTPVDPETGVTKIFPVAQKSAVTPNAALITNVTPFFGTSTILISSTSNGIIQSFDFANRKEAVIYPRVANYSDISYDSSTGEIMALSSAGSLYLFDAYGKNEVSSTTAINDWCLDPKKILSSREQFYVTCDFRPGLMEFDAEQMAQTGGIQLRGATDFRTGAWDVVRDSDTGYLYMVAGVVGTKKQASIVEVDPMRFRAARATILPDFGRSLALDEKDDRLFVTSATKNQIYEILLPDMKEGRTISGVAGAESLVFDSKRNCLYSGGLYSGVFGVVDAVSGHIVKQQQICSGIKQISMSNDGDSLFTLCKDGIYKVDLTTYLGKPKPAKKKMSKI